MNTPRRRSSRMNQCVDEMNSPGVNCLKFGKCVAETWHPIRKVCMCVGICSTPEEAADACSRKNLEYESRSEQEKVTDFEKLELQSKLNRFSGKKRGSVYREKSGKWRAEIQKGKVRHKLGSYSTAEDAREALNRKKYELGLKEEDAQEAISRKECAEKSKKAYDSKRLGLDSTMYEFRLMVRADKKNASCKAEATPEGKSDSTRISCGPSVSDRVNLGSFTEEAKETYDSDLGLKAEAEPSQKSQRLHHAYPTKSGRWTTEIRHPITKARSHLGCFDTAEEAKEAYDSKRCEFDLMFPEHKRRYQSKADAEQSQKNQRLRGVYPTKSGRWTTEIRHPITKVKSRLGTFDTAEEAKEAYDSKRREFDLMFPNHKKRNQMKGSCNKKLKQANDSCRGDSAYVSDDPSASSGGSMLNANVESVPMFVTEGRGEFDSDVIDSYGQLVGEYSRLDDELWLCRPEDDANLQHDEGREW